LRLNGSEACPSLADDAIRALGFLRRETECVFRPETWARPDRRAEKLEIIKDGCGGICRGVQVRENIAPQVEKRSLTERGEVNPQKFE
jgi:hypothetical protein